VYRSFNQLDVAGMTFCFFSWGAFGNLSKIARRTFVLSAALRCAGEIAQHEEK
jgi:hypothetical protein